MYLRNTPSHVLPSPSAALSLLFETFEERLRQRLVSLIPVSPDTITLPYLSDAVDVLSDTYSDCKALISDPSVSDADALSSYLDRSVRILDACNAVISEIERLRRGRLLLSFAFHLLSHSVTGNSLKARDAVSEWEETADNRSNGILASDGLILTDLMNAKSRMSAIGRLIYAVEAVSSLVMGILISSLGGKGKSIGVKLSGEFAWAEAYNEVREAISSELCRRGVEEMNAIKHNVAMVAEKMDGVDDGKEMTEMLRQAVKEMEVPVERLTAGLDRLGNAVTGLFRTSMAMKTTVIDRFSVGTSKCRK